MVVLAGLECQGERVEKSEQKKSSNANFAAKESEAGAPTTSRNNEENGLVPTNHLAY